MKDYVFPCSVAKKCGGCQLTNMPYDKQLSFKQSKVIKLLGKFCRVEEIIGMDDPYHYRNKVQAAFGQTKSGMIISGVYQSSTHNIVKVDSCLIEDIKADEIIVTVRELLKSFRLSVYNDRSGKGFLRHVLVKRAFGTGEIMVVLVTGTAEFKSKNNFCKALLKQHPEITTVIQNVNNNFTSLVLGDKEFVLYGDGYIVDELMGFKFRISPKAFYQINYKGTEILYGKALEFASVGNDDIVIDAYAGVGTIGIIASKYAKEVISVELNKDAVKDARINASVNRLKNIRFFCADATQFLLDAAKEKVNVDVVFMDPPRAGSTVSFMKSVCKLSPKKVVYISCNPETLARDLVYFSKNGYKVKKIQPVDMFPHTQHIETVVLLCKEETVHEMRLNSIPFELIKSGRKTIEMRLYDEKRKKIKINDTVIFTNVDTGEKLSVEVIKLHKFDNFKEMYITLPLMRCGYTEKNVSQAKASDMESYYPIEKQNKYGVLGIEIKVNNPLS